MLACSRYMHNRFIIEVSFNSMKVQKGQPSIFKIVIICNYFEILEKQ